MLPHIAGYVERAVRRKLSCEICLAEINKLEAYDNLNLIMTKDWGGEHGGLTKPKVDIVKICRKRSCIGTIRRY